MTPVATRAQHKGPGCIHARPHISNETCLLQVFVYDATPKQDAKSAYLRADTEAAGCTWRRVVGLSDGDTAARIREDCVDVLVELTGHTANNRLGVMACRPAPVQMTWIGYPNSTGLSSVDYRCAHVVLWSPQAPFSFLCGNVERRPSVQDHGRDLGPGGHGADVRGRAAAPAGVLPVLHAYARPAASRGRAVRDKRLRHLRLLQRARQDYG